MTPGTAIPGWIAENLPPYFKAHPATTEAIWAGCVSGSAVVAAVAAAFYGAASTDHMDYIPGIFIYAHHYNWLPLLITVALPAWRGHNAFKKAAAAAPDPAP